MKFFRRFIFVFALSIFAYTSNAQNVFSQNHEIDSLMRKVRAEINLELYADALDNIHLCLGKISTTTIEKNESDTIRKINAEYLTKIADYYFKKNDFENSITINKEALNIYVLSDSKNVGYALTLYNIALSKFYLGNYAEAISLATEALHIREKVLGKNHPDYEKNLSNLALFNSSLGNFSESIRLGTEALYICEKIYGRICSDYATILNNLATSYSALGNYSTAICMGTEAVNIREKLYGKKHQAYATSLYYLAFYNYCLGNDLEALRMGTEALNIIEEVCGKNTSDYSAALSNLALYNSRLGNFSEALRMGTEALNIVESIYGKNHANYAKVINALSTFNSDLGNYKEAIHLETEALNICKKMYGKEHPDYIASLNNLANYNTLSGNYSEAINFGIEALNICEKLYGRNHFAYASILNVLASNYSCLDNNIEAIHFGTEALKIVENIYGKDHSAYAMILNNLAKYNFCLGNYPKAVSLGTEAINIREKIYGKEHPSYIANLRNLAQFKEYNNQIPEFIKLWKECLILYQNNILSIMQMLPEESRNSYWESKKNIFEETTPQYAYEFFDDTLNTISFNSLIFSKGLLLNSGIETEKIILESGDTSLIAQYNEMKTNMSILNKLYEKPIAERFINADSLANVIKMQNMEIASKSKAYGDIRKNLEITWQDVQKHLSADDIAIEMASFPLNEDSTMYIALTIKKGYDCPKLITLFEERQLKTITGSDKYKSRGVYDLVWKPLADELKGIKNVYFAPTGELYNINIEALPAIVDSTDNRNYYRLSSTRQLAYIKDSKKSEGASVYGGLRYNTDIKTIEQDSQQYTASKTRSWNEDLLTTDSIDIRGGWQYLPGTLAEAKDVSTTMKKASMPTYLFTDTIGTESSFKALDGKGRKIIHISTHGFYFTDNDSTKMHKAGLDFMHFGNEHQLRYVEDKSLTRSGLLFAGCDTRLRGGEVPEGVDDGVLFAKEISNLDLRGLDLVTLSACETGLGDISGEGVFGLQRAFKKAGAQSILMSLWKVDDNATRLLMTKFYDNYLSKHMSKSESLKDAQHYVRTYNNGRYNDPKYWAAFIILDAI